MEKKELIDIDFNPLECRAMDAFLKGNPADGSSIQKEFIEYVKSEVKAGKDYCSCQADCDLHGNCFVCVQVHRGHGNHLPFCMQAMLNKKLVSLSELSEHTITDQVRKPEYLE